MDYFDEILAFEANVCTFDMSAGLINGNLLSGIPTVKGISVWSGVDPNPLAIQNGAATLDVTKTLILVPVKGMLAGVQYLIEVSSATNIPTITLGKQAVLPVCAVA